MKSLTKFETLRTLISSNYLKLNRILDFFSSSFFRFLKRTKASFKAFKIFLKLFKFFKFVSSFVFTSFGKLNRISLVTEFKCLCFLLYIHDFFLIFHQSLLLSLLQVFHWFDNFRTSVFIFGIQTIFLAQSLMMREKSLTHL